MDLRLLLFGTMITLIVSIPFSANAANDEKCSDALVVDSITSVRNTQIDLSVLHMVDEDSFKEAQKGLGSTASAILGGIPITANTKYSEYDQERHSRLEKFNASYSFNEAESFLSRKLSNKAKTAYIECLRLTTQSNGFHAYVDPTGTDDAFVSVVLRWNPPFGSSVQEIDVSVGGLKGSRDLKSKVPMKLKPQQNFGIDFEREPNEAFRLRLNAAGETRLLLVSKPPEFTPIPEVCAVNVTMDSNEPKVIITRLMGPDSVHTFVSTPHHIAQCHTDSTCRVKAHRRGGGQIIESTWKSVRAQAIRNQGGSPSWATVCTVQQ